MAAITTAKQERMTGQLINPFYSPSFTDDGNEQYKYAQYKPTFPNISWGPLKEVKVVDRGLHANWEKKNLLSSAYQLSDAQKDELCVFLYPQALHTKRLRVNRSLLAAERGVVCK
jgi:sulfonate dioxygenase